MPEHTRPPTPDSALSAEDYSAGGHAAPHAAILNAIPGGVLIHRQFSPLYANTAAARLLGFTTPTELLAQTSLLDLFPPALQAARLQRADAVLHEGVVQPPDIIPLATRSGLRWLEISESRFDWPGGPAVLVTLQDVSQQVQTQHSETLLREAINELSDSFILYDADDRVVLTNRRFHQIFPFLPAQDKIKGTAMAEMVRRSVANNVVTDPALQNSDKEPWIRQFLARRRSQALHLEEDQWPDGRWDLVREQRLATGGFVSVRTDITARKQAEFALKAHESKLEIELLERTKQLEAVLANIAQGVIVLNPDLRVVLTNQGLHDIVGYPLELGRPGTPVEALIRNRLEYGLHLPGESPQATIDNVVAQRLQAYRDLTHESYRHEFPNGRLIEIRRQKLPDGMIICTFTDVTNQAKAEEEVQRQRETLYQREKLSALGMLLAGVAHELNNPLSVVLGQAQMLQIEFTEPALLKRASRIRQAAERCAKIVKIFLAMARDEPRTKLPVQLNSLLEQTLDLVAYQMRNRDIQVSCAFAPQLPTVLGDPDQLSQVFVNLLLNASQAISDDSDQRRITITTRYLADSAEPEIEICDTGPGVPAELRRRIFDPFFTTKPTGVGTGVGLSVCHGIVSAHGGSIGVDAATGGGARFWVRLPANGAAAEQPVKPVAISAERGQAHILVIDDQIDIGELLIEFLDREDWQVNAVDNGQAALTRLASENYDVIICDLRMPEMDGPALFAEVSRHYPHLRERFIFATGDLLSEPYRLFLEQCGRPYLEKPFMPDQVREIVARLITAQR